jgi:UDP-glucose 4-epimerase
VKTILLTGASGFIGTHLIKAIEQHPVYSGYKLVLLSSTPHQVYSTILHKNYSFTQKDFAEAGINHIDIVIHAGAFTPKDNGAANNIRDANSNVSSLNHLIEQLPNTPERFIFFSTLDVYAPVADETITEQSVTKPISLYGWSKLYGEKVVEAWANKEKHVVQVLRIGHIYGSGEEQYQKIIPLTIKKTLQKQKPVIFSKGEELRSFLHVSDCVKSVLAAIELNEYAGPINIVSGRALPVKRIVELIINEIDSSLQAEIQGNDIPVRNLVFDNTKMKHYLAAENVLFEEGIKEEISRFKL